MVVVFVVFSLSVDCLQFEDRTDFWVKPSIHVSGARGFARRCRCCVRVIEPISWHLEVGGLTKCGYCMRGLLGASGMTASFFKFLIGAYVALRKEKGHPSNNWRMLTQKNWPWNVPIVLRINSNPRIVPTALDGDMERQESDTVSATADVRSFTE
jgi:hypothetical protein